MWIIESSDAFFFFKYLYFEDQRMNKINNYAELFTHLYELISTTFCRSFSIEFFVGKIEATSDLPLNRTNKPKTLSIFRWMPSNKKHKNT